jgi:hypothetical protein
MKQYRSRRKSWSIGFNDPTRQAAGDHQVVALWALSPYEMLILNIVTFSRSTAVWAMNGFCVGHLAVLCGVELIFAKLDKHVGKNS